MPTVGIFETRAKNAPNYSNAVSYMSPTGIFSNIGRYGRYVQQVADIRTVGLLLGLVLQMFRQEHGL